MLVRQTTTAMLPWELELSREKVGWYGSRLSRKGTNSRDHKAMAYVYIYIHAHTICSQHLISQILACTDHNIIQPCGSIPLTLEYFVGTPNNVVRFICYSCIRTSTCVELYILPAYSQELLFILTLFTKSIVYLGIIH